MHEQGKDLRFQPHRRAAVAQFEPIWVQLKLTKSPSHAQDYRKIAGFYTKSSDSVQASAWQRRINAGTTLGTLQT
jgi:hypothetical protein